MRRIYLVIVCLAFAVIVRAQSVTELFPGNLSVQPFIANTLEPKLGFLFDLGDNELRLDIGNSVDGLRIISDQDQYSFGADLFTYTLLRREKNFHFPVDAVDYLFGLNFCYVHSDDYGSYGARIRLSHISAHFADGHFDDASNQWRDNRDPKVYSREFIEFMPFYKINELRVYAGVTYIFHVDPVNLGKDNYQIGFDYFIKNVLPENIIPFIAYDLRMINLDKYYLNHSMSAGVKFGKLNGKGISIYLHYYSGKSIHGEYFDINKNYSSIGINIDL